MPISQKEVSAPAVRNRIIRRTGSKPPPPPLEEVSVPPAVQKTVPSAPAKKAVKKTAVKKSKPVPKRLSAKELFEVKPTKRFNLKSWQQGTAIGEQDLPNIGIAFPSLCWEMFVGHSVLPVSSCYALAGPTGSFKSHLVVEMARWVLNSGGYTILAENESKYNKDMAEAIIGESASDIFVVKCKSFNQVQQTLTSSLKKADAEEENPLLLQIIDSIVGNATDSSQDKVRKEGEIERGYPPNALAAANFLPNYMPMLGNKPYLGIWVTHSKEEKENIYQPTVVTLKGGGTWEYRCRIAFILNRVSEKPECDDRIWKIRLMLKLKKDASIRGFKLPFTIRSRYVPFTDEETGEIYTVRIVKFCWHEATIDLWRDPVKYGYPDYYSEVVKDLTGFTEVKLKTGKGFIAPKIGIGKDEASRDPKVIMNALYADENVLGQMRAEMGIQKGLEINPEQTFGQALKQAKSIALRRARKAQETAKITLLRREEINEFD
jgi:hypothetical protein